MQYHAPPNIALPSMAELYTALRHTAQHSLRSPGLLIYRLKPCLAVHCCAQQCLAGHRAAETCRTLQYHAMQDLTPHCNTQPRPHVSRLKPCHAGLFTAMQYTAPRRLAMSSCFQIETLPCIALHDRTAPGRALHHPASPCKATHCKTKQSSASHNLALQCIVQRHVIKPD